MTSARKPAASREKDLKLAIHRIERGRSHTKATSLSISAVAREAGVSAALIHNHYPAIAEAIRVKLGTSSRQMRDSKHQELKDVQAKNKVLRDELAEAKERIGRLASINEALLVGLRSLEARIGSSSVVEFPSTGREKG